MDLQHLVNHDFIVLDASDSMRPHRESLIKVIDGHVEFLARRSKELGQETRLSVYMFSNPSNVKNIVWDIDVLRMPSVRNIYKTGGMTALLDATHLAIDDLKTIPTKYGDHAFFGSIWTDGMENCSRNSSPINLKNKIDSCPDNWTVAAFVPNISAKHSAKTAGIPTDNIQIWDAVNPAGVAEVGRQLERASEVFFQGRTRGVRGYRSGYA
jgi:hypothetical protein